MIGDSLYIGKYELKNLLRDGIKTAAILVVILIPLIYGFLYLWAFWDPYGNIKSMPVAVVNLDHGGEYDGEFHNFGNEIIEDANNATSNITLSVESLGQAEKNLKNRKVYAIIIVPENFTEQILSIDQPGREKAQIIFKSRAATNFLGYKITSEMSKEITREINKKVSDEYIDTVADKIPELRGNSTNASSGTTDIYNGVKKLQDGVDDLREGAESLDSGANSLSTAIGSASSGSEQITENLQKISTGSAGVYQGMTQYRNVLLALHMGGYLSQDYLNKFDALINGSKSVSDSMSLVSSGSSSLSRGLSNIYSGSMSLTLGTDALKDGIDELSDKIPELKDGTDELNDKMRDINKFVWENLTDSEIRSIALMGLEPVELVDQSYENFENYGSGLAPYFIQLSLWVGGLILMLVILPKENKLIVSKYSRFSATLGKSLLPALIGALQAMVLGVALIACLGLKVINYWVFFAFLILLSWTFLAIIQFFIFLMGKAGEIPCIILLMLQLTSSAGTFPIETSPKFFQIINGFMPMTYGMTALREMIVSDANSMEVIFGEMLILSSFLILFFLLRWTVTSKKLNGNDIKPILEI